ncbi:MAG: hypothetical protein NTU73_08845, partial [Ignavibacteriae bacterium]|nr:hypothetical protein [Ignavibacteriota bacterium]
DNNLNNEDNLMMQEIQDLDNGGAVKDDDNGPMSPIDSLKRWGRKIVNVSINIQKTKDDTLKYVTVTRTITGNYIIIGYENGQLDSVTKPYTEVFYRNIIFKRVARTPSPRLNWRVYKVSNLDGGTTTPQVGSSQVQITKVEIYKNGSPNPTYNITGPDFQNNYYTTMLFGGTGIPSLNRGDQILVKVYTVSQQTPVDYVAYHWARNTFGFHRIPFTLESQNGKDRVYSKTFNIYAGHKLGVFNGYINASTHESLFDDDVNKFASDQIGIPYKILQ